MRGRLEGRVGMVLAFVLGLVIAGAATAGAASLITGKQIRIGSISTKDLSKSVNRLLLRAGTRGPTGPQGAVGRDGAPGAKGDPGPFPSVLPSGKTLTGVFSVTGVAVAANQYADMPISLGFRFASAPTVVTIGASDTPTQRAAAGCPGTSEDPLAAPGKFCLYEFGFANTEPLTGAKEADGSPTDVSGYVPPASDFASATPMGTILEIRSAAAGDFYSNGVWAATSP